MPYGISQNQSDCQNWAAVKQESDGSYTTLDCYPTKQEAIDRMIAMSLSEELEPLGEVGGTRQLPEMPEMEEEPEVEEEEEESEEETEEMIEGLAEMQGMGLNPRQFVMYETLEQIAEEFGMWDQGAGANGAHYMTENPFLEEGMNCANCVFYEGGRKCEIVQGDIAPTALCKLWIIREDLIQSEPEEMAQRVEMRQVDMSAPAFMRASAKRGLVLHEQGESGSGLMPQTVEDARKMAAGQVSEGKWRKIAPWIARHIDDLDAVQGDEVTAGLVAMLLWGGGSTKASARRAQAYAERIVNQLDEKRADAPAPLKDQIVGSEKNPVGSAEGKEGDISLSDATESALRNKAEEHNLAMADDSKPVWTRVRVGALRSVYRRGAGAFSTSHRPNMTRAQWAMARVNAFLYLAKNGKPENANYVSDNDLLHPEHPKYSAN